MIDAFLLVGLPYLALAVCVIGVIWRWKTQAFSWSSLSSQFLEARQLRWGSTPWHLGILVVLLGHGLAFAFPRVWESLMSHPTLLVIAETVGLGAGAMALAGLVVLAFRRLASGRVQAVTSTMDLVVLALLFFQVLLGVLTALLYRWGASWSTTTVVPYFWSLVLLQPDSSLVADLPPVVKAHLVGAWLILLAVPFSRLVHVLALPLSYLWRAPQIVIWSSPRRAAKMVREQRVQESRREFLKGAAGVAVAGSLLSLGVLEKLARFFQGPKLAGEMETVLLTKRLHRIRMTAEEQALQLERQKSTRILIGRLSELSSSKGKYFIDFNMAPALAFLDANGLPLLISAKCTHLGCTVGSEVNAQGQILCPCHISYFTITTGEPNVGAPAKTPLPHLEWVVVDASGKDLAHRGSSGAIQGSLQGVPPEACSVYVARPTEEAS
ncbi:MAG: respiratory nitrate reductase subunit gamma [Verrucomicrobiae bacterium]|nr:respiratory nitrate reductase subunit gamma [Verrucomicrobiae bacterium]